MSKSTHFDTTSFRRYVKYIGRAYRMQARVLVSICRAFVGAQEQTPASDARLIAVLEVVDGALKSATEAETKKSKAADEKFSMAIELLKKYEEDYHPSYPTVEGRMKEAKADDKSSSTFLHRLMEKDPPIKPEETKVVKFILQKSLLEASSTVTQELCIKSNINEVLWNFSRCKDDKRLTLKQNPHFYTPLPRSSGQYGGKYESDPIEEFQHDTISVLTDGLGRVHMEVAKKRRTFGGIWVANNVIIFKDIRGKLEGEGIVGGAIQNTDLSCFDVDSEGSLHSPTSLPATRDWRQPILTMLKSKDFDRKIHITDKPPASGSSGSSSALRSRPRSVRSRSPSPISATYSESLNSEQYSTPPTTPTNVLPSSSASSRPHVAHTATPRSSVPSQPRTSPASSPRPAPTAAAVAPPSSAPSQPRTSPPSSPRPAPIAAASAPPPSVPSQPRTSPTISPRPASAAITATPPSSVVSQPRASPAPCPRLAPTAATTAPPSSVTLVMSQPRASPASSPRPAPTAAIAAPPSSVLSQPRTSPASSPRPAPTAATVAPPSSVPSQPRTPPASPPRPAPTVATVAPPSSVPQPRTSTASPSRPAHAAKPPSSTVSTIPHHPSPQPPPTSTLRVTGVSTSAPSPRVEDPRTMVPGRASSPLPAPTQAINSQPMPQPAPRKKNWFQSHIWDYSNK